MGRLAPVPSKAQGKARRAARGLARPGKRRNAALRLARHRPEG